MKTLQLSDMQLIEVFYALRLRKAFIERELDSFSRPNIINAQKKYAACCSLILTVDETLDSVE